MLRCWDSESTEILIVFCFSVTRMYPVDRRLACSFIKVALLFTKQRLEQEANMTMWRADGIIFLYLGKKIKH